MTTEYLQLIVITLIGGLISLTGGVILLRKKKTADSLALYATPFAAGALLSAVFLDILSHGYKDGSVDTLLYSALVGILIFFFAERFLHWFHHHHQHEGQDATKPLIVVGDTMHNALDGVAIAAAFLISPATGIVTAVAVAAHEIPQEIGDFGLLLKKGMSRRNVLLVNILSAFATTVFAVITFALGSQSALPTNLLLGLSGGFLLYIAMSDIIPGIHESTKNKRFFELQPFLLLLGVVLVAITINIAHDYIDAGHDHDHSEEHSLSEDNYHSYNEEHHDGENSHDDEAHHGYEHTHYESEHKKEHTDHHDEHSN